MKQAVIDIGSNSVRLTLYETTDGDFKILFKEKIMAGLAGYVCDGRLSAEGIERACSALLEFKQTLEALDIENVAAFATASLRNITNTAEALTEIETACGLSIELLSGEEEASLSYTGAMLELNLSGGAFIDVGGASTEVVTFEDGKIRDSVSFALGSLNLYRSCVKNILPGPNSRKRIDHLISTEMNGKSKFPFDPRSPLVCVGGTSRAVLRMAQRCFYLPESCREISKTQFEDLYKILIRADKQAANLILRLEADRIHTLIPGMMILRHILHSFNAEEMIVGNYGLREGYLCRKILHNPSKITSILRTGS